MKPETMTNEELSTVLEETAWGSPGAMDRVRAHIAALEAERDDYKQSNENVLRNNDALREQLAVVGDALSEAQGERDALRERVQALRMTVDAVTKRADENESRLAAIRQRWMTFLEADVEREAVERDHLSNVVLGSGPVEGNLKLPSNSAPEPAMTIFEGARIDTREGLLEAVERDAAKRAEPEPTTAEAFATVRTLCEDADPGGEAVRALSLLERRMGAQEMATQHVLREPAFVRDFPRRTGELRAALTDAPAVPTSDEVSELRRRMGAMARSLRLAGEFNAERPLDHQWGNAVRDAVTDALTDAPAVFTLEEIEMVVQARYQESADMMSEDVADIMERLAALRT